MAPWGVPPSGAPSAAADSSRGPVLASGGRRKGVLVTEGAGCAGGVGVVSIAPVSPGGEGVGTGRTSQSPAWLGSRAPVEGSGGRRSTTAVNGLIAAGVLRERDAEAEADAEGAGHDPEPGSPKGHTNEPPEPAPAQARVQLAAGLVQGLRGRRREVDRDRVHEGEQLTDGRLGVGVLRQELFRRGAAFQVRQVLGEDGLYFRPRVRWTVRAHRMRSLRLTIALACRENTAAGDLPMSAPASWADIER